MKLPNGNRAEIDSRKLTAYSLNPAHEEGGQHKSRMFASVGLGLADVEELIAALYTVARESDKVVLGKLDGYGQRYTLDFLFRGTILLRSGWIVDFDKDYPRLATVYPLFDK